MTTPLYRDHEFLEAEFEKSPILEGDIFDMNELMCIAGPSEGGKSYLAIQTALDLASEGTWFGYKVLQPVSVLYVQAEISVPRLQERYRKVRGNYGSDTLPLAIQTARMKVDTEKGQKELFAAVEATEADVLILDPVRAFFSGDENSSKDVEAFFAGLAAVNCAVVYVHHTRKLRENGSKGGAHKATTAEEKSSVRGSSLLTDRPSTILHFGTDSTQTKFTLSFDKTRNRERRPEAIELKIGENKLFRPTNVLDPTTYYVEQVVNMVKDEAMKQTAIIARLAAQYNVDRKVVEAWLREAEARGRIVRTPIGGRGNPFIVRLAGEESAPQGTTPHRIWFGGIG